MDEDYIEIKEALEFYANIRNYRASVFLPDDIEIDQKTYSATIDVFASMDILKDKGKLAKTALSTLEEIDQEEEFNYSNCDTFVWRSEVLSPHGPDSLVARLAIATIAEYMDHVGTCTMSDHDLSAFVGVKVPTLRKHLNKACREGWVVIVNNSSGKTYYPRIPEPENIYIK